MPKKKSVPVRRRKTGTPPPRSETGRPPQTVRLLIVGQDAASRRAVREALGQPAPGGKGKMAGRSAGRGPLLSGLRITEAPETTEVVSLLQAASRPGENVSVAVLTVAPGARRPALKLARLLAETAPEMPLILCIPPEDGAWWENVAQRLHPWRVSVVTQPPDPLTLRGLIRAHLGRGTATAASPPAHSSRPKPAPAASSATPPPQAHALWRHVVDGLLQGLGQWCAALERPAEDREAVSGVHAAWSRCQRLGTVHRAAALVSQLTLLESPAGGPPGTACDLLQVTGQVVGHLQQLLHGVADVEGQWEPGRLLVPTDAPALQRVLSDLALLVLPAFPQGTRLRFNVARRAAAAGHHRGAPAGEAHVRIESWPAQDAPSSPASAGGVSPFLTGLEWTTAQALITRRQGRLKRSRLSNGQMLMEIHLPLLTEVDAPSTDPARLSPAVTPGGQADAPAGAVVLLVDDDESVRATTRLFLEEYDCRILEATDSTSALRVWKEAGRTIHLLVVDLVIPGEVDGLQLARRLRLEQPGLRILLTTGYAGAGLMEELKSMPDTDFLSKPYTYAQMHAVLRRHLRPLRVPA